MKIKDEEFMKDWNEMTLDEMVNYLREKYMFTSTSDAKCVHELIAFYDDKKSKKLERGSKIKCIYTKNFPDLTIDRKYYVLSYNGKSKTVRIIDDCADAYTYNIDLFEY